MDENIVIRKTETTDIESYWKCFDSVAQERKFLAECKAYPLQNVKNFVTGLLEKNIHIMLL